MPFVGLAYTRTNTPFLPCIYCLCRYVKSKMAPVCEQCNSDLSLGCNPEGFLECFDTAHGRVGTARWLYILCQGIFLGIVIDIIFLPLALLFR